MNMNDIRDDYGAEFIEMFTNEFVKGLGSKFFPEEELRDEIIKVRDHNYDPMFMEMLLAMFQLFEKKYKEGLVKYQEAMDITVLELNLADKHTVIQSKMINYLERKDTERANNAAKARHAENRAMKEQVFEWCDRNLTAGRSLDSVATELTGKLVPATWRTVRSWLTDYRKSRRSTAAS